MTPEKFKELWMNDGDDDHELIEVHEEIDDSWRHGNYMFTVYKYGDDYWSVSYQVSGDGEYHGIRENDFDLTKVYPKIEVTKTIDYVTDMPRPSSPTRYMRTYIEAEAIQFPAMFDVGALLDNLATGGSSDAAEDFVSKIEAMEQWLLVNDPDAIVKYRGDKLVLNDVEYPHLTWLIKEPGRPVYALDNDMFERLFVKV